MKAYIYAIRSHQTDLIYIGSTTQALSMRMSSHRRNYRCWKNGNHNYVTSYEIIKFDDNYIELLQEVEVESKLELRRIEGENIRKHDCVNKNIAGRTKVEIYQENKKQILSQNAKYYQENKEQIAEQRAIKYTCTCESIITTNGKVQHEKSEKHQAFINQSVIPNDNIL